MSWLSYRVNEGYVSCVFDNGREMKIDTDDLPFVSKHQWYIDSFGYPATGKNERLHRLLLGSAVREGMVVDHINRDKLDNRRCNLRICTQKVNVRNASLQRNNKSGVTGVFFDKRAGRWRAQIYHGGKVKHVGIFDDFDEAVRAREEAERRYYKGDDSNL